MVNLKLSLRSHEVVPLANVLNKIVHTRSDIDYVDFYNVQFLCKQLFDKNFSMNRYKNKKVPVSVNINVYRTIEMLYKTTPLQDWEKVILQDVIFQLDKQKVNLMPTP